MAGSKPSSLVFGTYGGDYGSLFKSSFEDHFTELSGITLVHDIGENPQRYAKMKAYRKAPKMQLVHLQDRYLYQASADGLLEDIDYSKVPNAAPIGSLCKKKNWLAYFIQDVGIIYNREKVRKEPKNWSDLLDDTYKGRIFIDDFSHFGLHITIALAMANGGGYDNMAPGFKVIREIKERLNPRFISTSQEGMKLLANGEVDVAMWQSPRAFMLKRQGKPIEYVVPETGDVAVVIGNAIAKNSGISEWGQQFLNVTADPDLEAKFASGVFLVTPANPTAKLDPQIAALTARPAGAKRIEIDYAEVLPRLDGWTKEWNRTIAS